MLYFAYTARIEPDTMASVCPSASFSFIAHLSGWGLEFPLDGNRWNGGLPTARPVPGGTVWGAVYEVAELDMPQLDAVELDEGRTPSTVDAIDRTGKRHRVATHVAPHTRGPGREPSTEYVGVMVRGSRHWALPAGWIVGLEDFLETDS